MILLLVGFLFSCASNLTKEELLTGPWEYVPTENEQMSGYIEFKSDNTYEYHGSIQGAKLLQKGTWSFSDKTELEIFVKKIIINDVDQQILGKNLYIHINTLTRGELVLEFGVPKQIQNFERK
jgi:hypothetical protein